MSLLFQRRKGYMDRAEPVPGNTFSVLKDAVAKVLDALTEVVTEEDVVQVPVINNSLIGCEYQVNVAHNPVERADPVRTNAEVHAVQDIVPRANNFATCEILRLLITDISLLLVPNDSLTTH